MPFTDQELAVLRAAETGEASTKPKPSTYTLAETAKLARVSRACLRMWEQRYGWPQPIRLANGYRVYAPLMVELIVAVAKCVHDGHAVGDLLRTGQPALPGREPNADDLRAQIRDLRRQVALLREIALMDLRRRFSEEGQRLADIALERSRPGRPINQGGAPCAAADVKEPPADQGRGNPSVCEEARGVEEPVHAG